MAVYRVYKVAKEFDISSEALVKLLADMGKPVSSHMSTIEQETIELITRKLAQEKAVQREQIESKKIRQGPVRPDQRPRPAVIRQADGREDLAGGDVAAGQRSGGAIKEPFRPRYGVGAAPSRGPGGPSRGPGGPSRGPGGPSRGPGGFSRGPGGPSRGPGGPSRGPDGPSRGPGGPSRGPGGPSRDAGPSRGPVPPRHKRRGDAPAGPGPAAGEGPRAAGEGGGWGKKKKKKKKVSQKVVAENIRRTLAKIDAGVKKKKRRKGTGGGPAAAAEPEQVIRNTVRVMEFVSLAELSDLIEVPAGKLVSTCIELGLMVTINQRLDFDTISLICEEFDFKPIKDEEYGHEMLEEAAREEYERSGEHQRRAPIVTVMGHVDHGKTTLLDRIRKSNIIAGESGGITQHIGAYKVMVNDEAVTFLDTPGHEAFTSMRARGAQVTDIVVLVVAADDSVQPQTLEAINHARAAGVPIIVAINKIDLPGANIMRVKQELANHGLLIEEYGGKVLCAEISAKKSLNVEHLLELILLQAEMMELTAPFEGSAQGVVIESRLDKGMGPMATVLLTAGTLKVGAPFVCGLVSGRVRAMRNERGEAIGQEGPASPVQIVGFDGVPQAGDTFHEVKEEREAKDISNIRQRLKREQDFSRHHKLTLNQLFSRIEAGEVHTLNLIIKGDVDGSVEALSDSLQKQSTEEVKVEVIHRGVGAITENDVILASASQAIIIGFHVRPDVKAREVAQREGVDIRLYRVIYEAVDDVRKAMEGMLSAEEREVVQGSLVVRQIYRISKIGIIAGCFVTEGKINRNHKARLVRDGVVVWEGSFASLKRFKEDVREVANGYECGVRLENFADMKVSDVIETFTVEEVKRQLTGSGN